MRLFALALLISLHTLAAEVPSWRPDGTAAVRERVGGAILAWPNNTAILRRTPALKIIGNHGETWIEFDYDYYAPTLSPRCEGLRSRPLTAGITIEDYMRSALSVDKLRAELGPNGDCIRSGRGWIREDRLR